MDGQRWVLTTKRWKFGCMRDDDHSLHLKLYVNVTWRRCQQHHSSISWGRKSFISRRTTMVRHVVRGSWSQTEGTASYRTFNVPSRFSRNTNHSLRPRLLNSADQIISKPANENHQHCIFPLLVTCLLSNLGIGSRKVSRSLTSQQLKIEMPRIPWGFLT